MSHIRAVYSKSEYKVIDDGDEFVVVCVKIGCTKDTHQEPKRWSETDNDSH